MNVYCIDGEGSLYQLVKSVYPECQVFRGGRLSRQFLLGFDIVFLDASLDQDKVTSLLNLKLSTLFLVVREYSGIDVLLPKISSSPLRLVLLKDLRERKISLEEISVMRKKNSSLTEDVKLKEVMPDLAWDIINDLANCSFSQEKWENLFLEWVCKVSRAERISLFIEKDADFLLKYAIGDAEGELKGMCFAAGEELKKTFRSGQRIFYHDLVSEGDYSNLYRVMESLLAVASLSFELNGERAMIFLSGSKDGSVSEKGILESILWIADIFAKQRDSISSPENNLVSDKADAKEYVSDRTKETRELLRRLSLRTSNDFRNALVSIKTFTQLMPKRYKDANFRNDFFAVLSAEIKRLESLVSELSFFSDSHQINMSDESVRDILEEAIDEVNEHFPEVSFNYNSNNEYSACIDRELFKKAFVELLKNSAQSMSGKGSVLIKHEKQSKGRLADFLKIEIRDKGHGIDEDIAEKIGEPFISSRPNGLGLGLVVVKEIIDLHGGLFEIHNIKEGGTEVQVLFPQKQPLSPKDLKQYLSGKN